MSNPTYVTYPTNTCRTMKEWRGVAKARAWARETGLAIVLKMNGSGVVYYTEGEKLRQKTFADMRPSNLRA